MAEESTGVLEASQTQVLRVRDRAAAIPSQAAVDQLRAMDQKLQGESVLRHDEIALAVHLAQERGIARDLYKQAMAEIRKEAPYATAVNDEINMLGNTVLMTADGPRRLTDQITETHNLPVVVNGNRPDGVYFHNTKHIMYKAAKQTPRDHVNALATTGRHGGATQLVFHERTHAVQWNLGSAHMVHELAEAHAYRVGGPFDLMSHGELVRTVFEQTAMAPLYTHLERRKFEAAVGLIDQLNGLGYSQEGIVAIIGRPGPWDDKTGSWKQASEVVERERARQGLNRDELDRRIDIRRLQKSLDISRARLATQQVLLSTFGPEIAVQRRVRAAHPSKGHYRPKYHTPRHSKAS